MAKLRDGKAALLVDGEQVAPVEVAASPNRRSRGLLGRTGVDGGLLITPCSGVHTFRMRFDLDVAYIDKSWTVLTVVQMKRNRMGRNRLRARHVLEAEWGALERWGVGPGTTLEVRYGDEEA